MHSDDHGVTSVPDNYWFQVAKYEEKKNLEVRHQHGHGVATVFVLDTSESMAGRGFQEMKDIFTSIVEEISKHPEYDENVAVVTFGKTVKFAHYLTNDYQSLMKCLDNTSCSGPSPMTAGIALSTAVFNGGVIHKLFLYNGFTSVIGDWHVRTRIIVITDGRATDCTILNGAEDQALYDLDRVKAHLLHILQNLERTNQITFIPVGDPDMLFLELIKTASKSARLVSPVDARQLGKYASHVRVAQLVQNVDLDDLHTDAVRHAVQATLPGIHLDNKDMENIRDLVRNEDVFKRGEDIDEDNDIGEMEALLLPQGTRVRRGPHWQWDGQDSDGPGTVVGYGDEYWTAVQWDNGRTLTYRYNLLQFGEYVFDIVECSEPRVLLDGEKMAVGCLVTRGPDWKWGDQDGYKGQKGAVYRVSHRGIIHVRWANGVKSNYRFGFDGKFDVQLCDPFAVEENSQKRVASEIAYLGISDKKPNVTSERTNEKSNVLRLGTLNLPSEDKNNSVANVTVDINRCNIVTSAEQPNESDTDQNNDSTHQNNGDNNRNDSSLSNCPQTLSESLSTWKSSNPLRFVKNERECSPKLKCSDNRGREFPEDADEESGDYVWQWKDSSEKWITYPDDINDIMNSRFKKNQASTLSVEMENQCFRIDMSKFEQTNTITKEATEIRRLYPVEDQ